jgi:hypothetical protein
MIATPVATQAIAMGSIVIDESLQPRCDGVNLAHVKALMESPETWPPVIAVSSPDGPVLVDGFHRYKAARKLGLDLIPARILPPPSDGDLFGIAFELNAVHGRPLTLRDRKAYATKLFEQHANLADREIGRRAGLSHSTVAALRTGQNGQRYRIPPRNPGEPPRDIGLVDPIRFAHASRAEKSVAGFIKRVTTGLDDAYDENGDPQLEGWSTDPVEIARACYTTMGAAKASRLLEGLEYNAAFLLDIARARKVISQQMKGQQ